MAHGWLPVALMLTGHPRSVTTQALGLLPAHTPHLPPCGRVLITLRVGPSRLRLRAHPHVHATTGAPTLYFREVPSSHLKAFRGSLSLLHSTHPMDICLPGTSCVPGVFKMLEVKQQPQEETKRQNPESWLLRGDRQHTAMLTARAGQRGWGARGALSLNPLQPPPDGFQSPLPPAPHVHTEGVKSLTLESPAVSSATSDPGVWRGPRFLCSATA